MFVENFFLFSQRNSKTLVGFTKGVLINIDLDKNLRKHICVCREILSFFSERNSKTLDNFTGGVLINTDLEKNYQKSQGWF